MASMGSVLSGLCSVSFHRYGRSAILHCDAKAGSRVCCAVSAVTTLSGGELQRVAIALCLGTPADVYLIDEPSAYLDSEQRISCSKVPTHHIGRLKPLRALMVNLWARR